MTRTDPLQDPPGGARPGWDAQALGERLGAEVRGDPARSFDRLEPIERAGPDDLTFVRDERRLRRWLEGDGGGAIVAREAAPEQAPPGRTLLIVDDADAALRTLLLEAAPTHVGPIGRHSTCVVHESATLEEDVRIGAQAVIGPGWGSCSERA